MPRHPRIPASPLLYALVIFFYSCSGSSEKDKIVIKQMEESLVNSNKIIGYSTDAHLKALEEKTQDPATMERAKVWFSKARQIATLSRKIYDHIEGFKNKIHSNKKAADSLHEKLLQYKQDILNTDSLILLQFEKDFKFIKSSDHFSSSGLLTSLENNIKISENKIITFCEAQIGSVDGAGFFNSYSFLASQNSNIVKPGDDLEIVAGIGSFSRAAQPNIKINGLSLEIGEENYAHYKMKVLNIPGKYKIPVSISYFNNVTGKDETRSIDVEYTVAKSCDELPL
ncbi:MAG: hypothetical protein ABIR30_04935 [Chitinophagaceae bacterium]